MQEQTFGINNAESHLAASCMIIICGVTRRVNSVSAVIIKFDGKYAGAKYAWRADHAKFTHTVQYDRLQLRPCDTNGEDNVAKHSPLLLLGTVFVVMNLPAAQ